jgi:hypothetical protein
MNLQSGFLSLVNLPIDISVPADFMNDDAALLALEDVRKQAIR